MDRRKSSNPDNPLKTTGPSTKIAISTIVGSVVIIGVICLAYLSQREFRETMVSQTQQQLLTIARTTAASVGELIVTHSEALQTISRDMLLQEEMGGRIFRFL